MTRDTTGVNGNPMTLVHGDEIFFRSEDVRLIGSLVEAIAGDLSSLELIGASKPAIDHYGRILLTRLRRIPGIQLEAYLPTGVESLVDEFNAALSAISMAEATSGGNRERAIKVFISNEISAGNSRDGRMLSRLVSNFPGANIKLVWVHQDNSGGPRVSALEFAGKHAARWFISPPNPAEVECMLADGARTGQQERVQQLLKKVAPDMLPALADDARPRRLTARQEPAINERQEMTFAATALPRSRRDAVEEGDRTDGNAPKMNARQKMSHLAMFNGIFLVTCLSAIVIAFIFPGHIQTLAEMLGISPPPIKPLQGAKDPAKNFATAAPLLSPLAPPAAKKQADESAAVANAIPRSEAPAVADVATGNEPTAGNAPGNIKGPPADARTVSAAKPAVVAPTVPVPNDAAGKDMSKAAATAPPPVKNSPPATPATNAIVAAPAIEAKSALATGERKMPAVKKTLPPENQSGGDPLGKAAAQINGAKKGNFFVQFVALESYAAAAAWRDKYDKLSRAQIAQISVEQGAKSKFVVISGPFRSRDAAEAFAAQKGLPGGAWIRGARPLQAALQKPETAAPGKKAQEQKSE